MNAFANNFAAASLALAVGIPQAQAGVLGVGANVNPFDVTATEREVPLRADGSKAVTFTTTRPNTVVAVTYNAECTSVGPIGTWVAVRITVDNLDALPAAGRGFALCSSVDPSALIPIAASRQAVISVFQAGTHTVRVLASVSDSNIGRLDDSSIIIRD